VFDSAGLQERMRLARLREPFTPEGHWRYAQNLDVCMPDGRVMRPPGKSENALLMEARVSVVASPDFKPTKYLDPSPSGADEGWIAWHILPHLRTVLKFAKINDKAKMPAVEAALKEAVALAEGFVRRRLSECTELGRDDRVVVERHMNLALAGEGTGGRNYLGQDRSEPEREQVNHMLGIESPWSELPLNRSQAPVSVTSSEVPDPSVRQPLRGGVEVAPTRENPKPPSVPTVPGRRLFVPTLKHVRGSDGTVGPTLSISAETGRLVAEACTFRTRGESTYPGAVVAVRNQIANPIEDEQLVPGEHHIIAVALWGLRTGQRPFSRMHLSDDTAPLPAFWVAHVPSSTGFGRLDAWLVRAEMLRDIASGNPCGHGCALSDLEFGIAFVEVTRVFRTRTSQILALTPPSERDLAMALAVLIDSPFPTPETLTVAIRELRIAGPRLPLSSAKLAAANRPAITKAAANEKARELLTKDPSFADKTAEEWRVEIGCSKGLVAKLPVWKAIQERRQAEAGAKAVRTPQVVSLTPKLGRNMDTSGKIGGRVSASNNQILNNLIRQQADEGELSPLAPDPDPEVPRLPRARRVP
jgi:hypothetical protein